MSLLGVPEFSAFPLVLTSSSTTPTPLESDLTHAPLRSGVDRLAIWPIRLQSQRRLLALFVFACEVWERAAGLEPYQCDGQNYINTYKRCKTHLETTDAPGAYAVHLCFECWDTLEAKGQGTPLSFLRRRRIAAGGGTSSWTMKKTFAGRGQTSLQCLQEGVVWLRRIQEETESQGQE